MTTHPPQARPPETNGSSFWARQGVTIATRVLPAGPTRDRYRQEFIADLHVMALPKQATYTLGVITNAWALRAAVAEDSHVAKEATMKTQHPLTCRFNLHHDWHTYSTEDGGRYRQCTRCGKYHPGTNYPGEGTAYPV